jgi:hypothetical protein
MNNPYLYLIMRGDMPSMNPGKLAAQAAHGASMFHERARNFRDTVTDTYHMPSSHWFVGYNDWVRCAKDFGVTIVLTATKQEIMTIQSRTLDGRFNEGNDFVCDTIVDPSYPFTMDTEIYEYVRSSTEEGFLFQNVSDLGNGKTFATRNEMSGFWIFGEKEQLVPYIGHLKLYP